MLVSIYVEPHERYEAIEAYRDRLTAELIAEIEDAPDGARIRLQFGGGPSRVTVLEPEANFPFSGSFES